MQRTAQKSQQKSGNLKVYAFEVSRINAATLSLKLRLLGGASSIRRITVSELPTYIAQIEQALAENVGMINIGSGICDISSKLLKKLKRSLSSYAVSGGSGVQVVREGVSTPIKSKAPARAVSLAARKNLIATKDLRANSDVDLDNNAHTARTSADFGNQISRIVGDELRKVVMPLLAEIDAIVALVRECAAELSSISKKIITSTHGEFEGRVTPSAPRHKDVRESYYPKARHVNAEGSIFTRRSRTSVVVGRRKVS